MTGMRTQRYNRVDYLSYSNETDLCFQREKLSVMIQEKIPRTNEQGEKIANQTSWYSGYHY